MKKEIIFGNHNYFGIRYIPGWKSKNEKYTFATLHLILRGQIIGYPNETCLLGTWLMKIESILKIIQLEPEKLYHEEFENRTDLEIFELIYKANQLEEEYDAKFNYLPILPDLIWRYCNVRIDETIDSYQLAMTVKNDQIRFIWKRRNETREEREIETLNSVIIKVDKVVETISKCIAQVKIDMMN